MPGPTYDQFIEPILRHLATRPEGASARESVEAAADMLNLSADDRIQVIPSGQPVYRNRGGWAHDRLKRAGFSSSLRRGIWQLTEKGLRFAQSNSSPLPKELVETLASRNNDVLLSQAGASRHEVLTPKAALVGSPDEQLESALHEIRSSVVQNLLEMLAQVTPQYFEKIVLDVLHSMGYGGKRSGLHRVGGVGDGGIDGVISLDKLGLEKVYVQAKRWQGNVGRPEIQAFYGALAGQKASRGVFITTSAYTVQAKEFAKSVDRTIVLVDGLYLAELMVEYGIGVTSRILKVPQLDSDYFDH
jgi:restriction system protein